MKIERKEEKHLVTEEPHHKSGHEMKLRVARNKKRIIYGFIIFLFVVVFLTITNIIIRPQMRYSHAKALLENGDYENAITAFESLGDYKDSNDLICSCYYSLATKAEEEKLYTKALEYLRKSGSLPSDEEVAIVTIMGEKVGKTVSFGSYEQDNDVSNGSEQISWTILSNADGIVTLLSNNNLDCKKYNETWQNVSWDNCSLRMWLNSEFMAIAFSNAEKEFLVPDTIGDFVSILTAQEWKEQGDGNGTQNTAYAISQGVYNENGKGWTWLKDAGIDNDHAQEVDCTGSVNEYGSFVDCDNEGVRPVIRLKGGVLNE